MKYYITILLHFNHEFLCKILMLGAFFVKVVYQKAGISGMSDKFSIE